MRGQRKQMQRLRVVGKREKRNQKSPSSGKNVGKRMHLDRTLDISIELTTSQRLLIITREFGSGKCYEFLVFFRQHQAV